MLQSVMHEGGVEMLQSVMHEGGVEMLQSVMHGSCFYHFTILVDEQNEESLTKLF